jgi:putative selenate reductase FAD-binding subunit
MITQYYRPGSVEEAQDLKKSFGGDALFLAGGTEINRLHSPFGAPTAIDIGALGLNRIEKHGDRLIVGAAVTLQQLTEDAQVPGALKKAASFAAGRPLRHMATVGGNIASDRRDSYLLPALLAMDARVEVAGQGEVDLSFWLEQKEGLLVSVIIPNDGRCVLLERITRTVQGPPVLVAAYACGGPQGKPRFVIGGLPGPARSVPVAEEALSEGKISDGDALARLVAQQVTPVSDYLGSADYKRYIAGVTASDLFTACSCEGRG